MAFDEILAQIQDAADREQIAALAGKYPNIKQFVEYGEQVKPVIDELSQIEGVKPLDEVGRIAQWTKWTRDPNGYPKLVAAQNELIELKPKYDELLAKGETEMTYEEMKAKLLEDGTLASKEDLKDVIKRPDMLGALNQFGLDSQRVYSEIEQLRRGHEQTFNEDLPREEIFRYMQSHQTYDPVKKALVMPAAKDAYESMMAPRQRELIQKQHEAEVERVKKEAEAAGEAKGRQLAAAALGQTGNPVDGGGSRGTGLSKFAARIFARRGEQGSGRLGDGSAARAGLQDHLQRQASGSQL